MVRSQSRSRNDEREELDFANDDQRRDHYSDDRINEQYNDNQDNILEKKRTRGNTYLPHVWTINPNRPGKGPLEVQFNKFGKPIGPNKSKYVEFLGTIARNGKLAPLDVKNWHKMSESVKRTMVELVKEKFVCSPGFEINTLQALGKSWRSFKNRLKTKYFDPNLSVDQNLHRRPTSPDERVLPEHWKYLINFWSSEPAKKMSEKNKENRGLRKMQHITGKTSFAQIRELEKQKQNNDEIEDIGMDDTHFEDETDEEISRADLFAKCYAKDGNTSNPIVADALQKMRILQSQLQVGAQDKGPNDIFAQVTGPDKGGRVRMYGYGIAASDVHGDTPSRASSYRMNTEYKAELEKMKQRLDAQDQRIQDLLRVNKEMTKNDHPNVTRVSSPSTSRIYAPSRYPRTSSNGVFPLQVGATVYLKSMLDSSKIVAKGFIESLDPSKLVGHEVLGQNWCEVKINVAMEYEESLIRSMENIQIIGDAIGSTIAWPKFLIVVDEPW